MLKLKPSFFACLSVTLLLSVYFRDTVRILPALTVIFVCIGAAGITLVSLELRSFRRAGFLVIAASLGFLLGTTLDMRMTNDELESFTGVTRSAVTSFRGICVTDSSPLSSKKGTVVTVDLITVRSKDLGAAARAKGRALVFIDGAQKLYAGEIVDFTGRLSPYEDSPGIGFSSGVSASSVGRIGYNSFLSDLRHRIIESTNGLIERMGYPASSLFRALFLGAREDLASDIADSFKTTGTLHILALSGMHVGLIFALINLISTPFLAKRPRIIVSIVVIAVYVVIAGGSPSLMRAAVMIGALGCAKLFDRETEPINILAISAVVIICFDPVSAFSISFQLSYLAMLGIFIIGDPLSRRFSPYMPGFLALSIAYSIGAQIFTMPIVIQNFGIVYFQGIIVTLLLGPLITVFLTGGIISLLAFAAPVYPFHETLGFAFNFLYDLIFGITRFFSGFGGLHLEWNAICVIVFILVLVPFVVDLKAMGERFFWHKKRIAMETP